MFAHARLSKVKIGLSSFLFEYLDELIERIEWLQ
jgi:hypothetical protein